MQCASSSSYGHLFPSFVQSLSIPLHLRITVFCSQALTMRRTPNGLLMRRFTDGPSASGTGLRFLTCNWIQLHAPCLKGRPRNNPGIRRDKDRTRFHINGPKSAITFSITQSVKYPFLHRFAVPSVSFGDRVVFLRIARWALWSIELLCIISLECTFIRSADAFIRRDL